MSTSTTLRNEQPRELPAEKTDNRRLQSPLASSSKYEIVVPVTSDEKKTGALVQYASTLAKNYSMKLVLVAAVPDTTVPEGFLAYARAEGIRDPTYLYIETAASELLSKWEQALEAQNVEYGIFVHLGSMKQALKEVVKIHSNVSLVVTDTSKKLPTPPVESAPLLVQA